MHAHNITSIFLTYLLKVLLNFGLQAKCLCLIENRGSESIFGDKFVTQSKINVLTAHVQTL